MKVFEHSTILRNPSLAPSPLAQVDWGNFAAGSARPISREMLALASTSVRGSRALGLLWASWEVLRPVHCAQGALRCRSHPETKEFVVQLHVMVFLNVHNALLEFNVFEQRFNHYCLRRPRGRPCLVGAVGIKRGTISREGSPQECQEVPHVGPTSRS